MDLKAPQCAKCGVLRCRKREQEKQFPGNCPTANFPDIIQKSITANKTDDHVRSVNQAWIELNKRIGRNAYSWTRLEEVIEFAKIREAKKLGIASCFALLSETRLLTNILESHDFEVYSVSCLAGEVTPKDVDLDSEGVFCNPVMQAEVLNRLGTDLNIMMGLCVGHDILFIRHSKADVTPLVVKDRATGHNPVAALYLSAGYFRRRFIKKKPE